MLEAALLGLGTGALVGAIALAVVLTHRGSGVVDFSAGAVAMVAAYVFDGLRRDGALLLPPLPNPLALLPGDWPVWPTLLDLGGPMAAAPAFLVTLLAMLLVGLAVHLLVWRPLLAAPPLAKVVASVGLMVVLPGGRRPAVRGQPPARPADPGEGAARAARRGHRSHRTRSCSPASSWSVARRAVGRPSRHPLRSRHPGGGREPGRRRRARLLARRAGRDELADVDAGGVGLSASSWPASTARSTR